MNIPIKVANPGKCFLVYFAKNVRNVSSLVFLMLQYF